MTHSEEDPEHGEGGVVAARQQRSQTVARHLALVRLHVVRHHVHLKDDVR